MKESICHYGSWGSFIEDLQWRMNSLPIRVSKLCLYSKVEVSSNIVVASMAKYWILQDHILRDIMIYGMDFYFKKYLNGLSVTIPDFDLSNLTSRYNIPPKAQYVLVSAFFSKKIQDMEVKFDMTK